MLKLDVVKERLEVFGTTWLVTFLLVLIGTIAANLIFRVGLLKVADVLLAISFFSLILLVAGFALAAFFGDEPIVTKMVLVALTALLFLPLLYAPVLALSGYAYFDRVDLAGSEILVGFRDVVNRTLSSVTSRLFSPAFAHSAVTLLQRFAAVVGAIAAVSEVWRLVRNRQAPPAKA